MTCKHAFRKVINSAAAFMVFKSKIQTTVTVPTKCPKSLTLYINIYSMVLILYNVPAYSLNSKGKHEIVNIFFTLT